MSDDGSKARLSGWWVCENCESSRLPEFMTMQYLKMRRKVKLLKYFIRKRRKYRG